MPTAHTVEVAADDIPVSVTSLVYSDPSQLVLSQNQFAAMLTHYWPAIEQHFRGRHFDEAADLIDGEAWPHERDERENRLIYQLVDLLRSARSAQTPQET